MAIVTLTTDFGTADHYVGVMKGVILGIAPSTTIVDITHQIPPQDLVQPAVVLVNLVEYFPAGTVHVVVVDPGVGGGRRVVLIESAGQRVLVPDNGLATLLVERHPPERVVSVEEARYFLPRVSRTFHGRDIFAPVAARLAEGLAPEVLGPLISPGDLVHLPLPRPRRLSDGVVGEVLYADRFGNLITNIPADDVWGRGEERVRVEVADRTCPLVNTYADAPPGALVALVGSSNLLEISQVQGSAQRLLGVGRGCEVRVLFG